MHASPRRLVPAVVLALTALAACSGGGKSAVKATPTPTASPTPTATAAPVVRVTPDLLTGSTRVVSTGPVVAVKIDNAPLARPYQTGLNRASVVYQEIVEGGLTRFLAIYEAGTAPNVSVGPVRSGRESDINVLRAYDKPTIAFSGAQPGVISLFKAAARAGYLVVGSYDTKPSAYTLGAQRRDARNFFVNLTKLAALNPGNHVTDIGFTFSAAVPVGTPETAALASYSPDSRVAITYDAATQTYELAQNGRHMPTVAPSNVIIQRVNVYNSKFVDVHKQPTPYSTTTGSGAVVILRNGVAVHGTWKRTKLGATRYYDAAGHQIALHPGKTWILLVPTSGSFR